MLDTLPLPTSTLAPMGGPASVIGNSAEAAAFSILLDALENAIVGEPSEVSTFDALPVDDGKIGTTSGKILPDLPASAVEVGQDDEPMPDTTALVQQVGPDPVPPLLPIISPVVVPVQIVPTTAPISERPPTSAPTVIVMQRLPTTVAPLPVVLLSPASTATPVPIVAATPFQPAQDGETDPIPSMPTVNATLVGRGQVASFLSTTISAPHPITPPPTTVAAPEPAPSSSPPLAMDGIYPADAPKAAARTDASAPAPAPAAPSEPAAEPLQPLTTPIRQDQIAAPPAVTSAAPIEATGSLRTAPATPAPETPQAFAALVGKLNEARETAGPQPVRTVFRHAEFGPVALEFRHEDRGLSVTMASGAPGFNGTVQAAVAATLASGQMGDPPRDGGQQSPQPGVSSTSSGSDQSPDQRQTATTDPRADRDHPSDRRQGARQDRQPGNEVPPHSPASDTGRSGIYA